MSSKQEMQKKQQEEGTKVDLMVVLTIFDQLATEQKYLDEEKLEERINNKLKAAEFKLKTTEVLFSLPRSICLVFVEEHFVKRDFTSSQEEIVEYTINEAWGGKKEEEIASIMRDIVKDVVKDILEESNKDGTKSKPNNDLFSSSSGAGSPGFSISYLLHITKDPSYGGSMENLKVEKKLARYQYLGTLYSLDQKEEKKEGEKKEGGRKEIEKKGKRRFFLLETSSTLKEKDKKLDELETEFTRLFPKVEGILHLFRFSLEDLSKEINHLIKKIEDENDGNDDINLLKAIEKELREEMKKEEKFELIDSKEVKEINLKFSKLRKGFVEFEKRLSLLENKHLALKNSSERLKRQVEEYEKLIKLAPDFERDKYVKRITAEEQSGTSVADLHLTNLRNSRDEVRELIGILNIHFSEHRSLASQREARLQSLQNSLIAAVASAIGLAEVLGLKIEPTRSSQDILEQQWKLIMISSVSFLVFFLSHVLFNLRRANTWVDYLLACLSGLAVGGLMYPFVGPYYAVPAVILWGLFSSFFILFMEKFTVESSSNKRKRLSSEQSQKGEEYWIDSTKETFKKALGSSVEDIKSFFGRIKKELSYLFHSSIKSKSSGENVKNSKEH